MFEKVKKNERAGLSEDLIDMLEEEDLRRVICGDKLGIPLEIDSLAKSAKMQA